MGCAHLPLLSRILADVGKGQLQRNISMSVLEIDRVLVDGHNHYSRINRGSHTTNMTDITMHYSANFIFGFVPRDSKYLIKG